MNDWNALSKEIDGNIVKVDEFISRDSRFGCVLSD